MRTSTSVVPPVAPIFAPVPGDGYWERAARAALVAGCRVLDRYRTRSSRHDFTQRQLLATLVLMKLLKTTYRGIVEALRSMPGVRDVLGLDKIPHWTTLHKFATRRCDAGLVNLVLARLALDLVGRGGAACDQALDSTGIDSSCASRYYRGRAGALEARYVKASVAVICSWFLPTVVIADWGPTPDATQALTLAARAVDAVPTRRVLADRGYDLEALHVLLREQRGVESVVPAVPRRGVVKSPHRARMTGRLEGYGRRWHVETFISMLKRLTGPGTNARGPVRPLTDTALKVLAVAIHIARPDDAT